MLAGLTIGYVYKNILGNLVFVMCFGFVSAFCSTMLSICICTDIADETKKYGQTTAIVDGGATIVAAFAQLFAYKYFAAVDIVSAPLLCATSFLLILLTKK